MKKLTQEEMNSVNSLKSSIDDVVGKVGVMHLQTSLLKEELVQLEGTFKSLLETEQTLVKELTTKYGPNVDFTTGEVQ